MSNDKAPVSARQRIERDCAKCGMAILEGESVTRCSYPDCPEVPIAIERVRDYSTRLLDESKDGVRVALEGWHALAIELASEVDILRGQLAARSSTAAPVAWRWKVSAQAKTWSYADNVGQRMFAAEGEIIEPLYVGSAIKELSAEQAKIDFEEACRDHRDAERYRWLQTQECGNVCGKGGPDEDCYLQLNPRDMDMAIDAAMNPDGEGAATDRTIAKP